MGGVGGRGVCAGAMALALAAAMGCGSSSDGEQSGGGLDATSEAQPAPDADLPLSDAGADADAADARKDVLIPGSSYCAGLVPKPKFCDDFDDGDLTGDWDQSTVLPPSVIDLDDSTFASAPLSFFVATKPVAAGSAGNASLRKTVLGAVSHVNLAFSARFTTTTITKGLVAIATLDVSLNHFFTLYLRDGDPDAPAAVLEEQSAGTLTRHLLTRLPPAATWTRIVIDLEFTTGKASVSFGGQKALDAAPIALVVGTEATIRVGAVYVYGPTEPFEARYDDVVLDF